MTHATRIHNRNHQRPVRPGCHRIIRGHRVLTVKHHAPQFELPLTPPRQTVIECGGNDLAMHCASLREKGYHLTRLECIGASGYRITAEGAELFKACTTGPLPAGSS